MTAAPCPNCNEYFRVDRLKYIGDHIAPCDEQRSENRYREAMRGREIYTYGRNALMTFIAFLALCSVGTVGGGVFLIAKIWAEGLSAEPGIGAAVLFLVGWVFLALLKSNSMALKGGTQQVSGEATFWIMRGETSEFYYTSVGGQTFGVAADVYCTLEDGDHVTMNYYKNNWVKSVYLNRRAEAQTEDKRLGESATSAN